MTGPECSIQCAVRLTGRAYHNLTLGSSPLAVACTNPYGVAGRYVALSRVGATGSLGLCEVQVGDCAAWWGWMGKVGGSKVGWPGA